MKVHELYEKEPINIESYLTKCGVKDVEEYLSNNYIEPLNHYDNIERMAKELLNFVKGD